MKALFFILILTFQAQAATRKIAVLYWSMNIEGQVAMRKGLESESKKYNEKSPKGSQVHLIPFVAGDGKSGVERQINQFGEAIRLKPDAIIIQPTDNAALSAKLKEANRKKIPVIAFDQYIVEGKLDSFITSDNYQAGRLNAEYISSLFSNKTSIKIVVFEYPKVSSTTDRLDGFFDTLREYGKDFEVLKRYEAVEPSAGQIAARQFLKDFPTKGSVDVIFTVNDGGGLAVVQELLNVGRTEIKHATVDGDPKSVLNVINKKITVIDSAQFCAEIGRQSFIVAIDLLNGKTVPKKVIIPTFPVTEKTAPQFLGWMSVLPKPFRKDWTSDHSWWEGKIKKK